MSLTAARYWRADPRGVVRLLNQVFISGAVRFFKRQELSEDPDRHILGTTDEPGEGDEKPQESEIEKALFSLSVFAKFTAEQ